MEKSGFYEFALTVGRALEAARSANCFFVARAAPNFFLSIFLSFSLRGEESQISGRNCGRAGGIEAVQEEFVSLSRRDSRI